MSWNLAECELFSNIFGDQNKVYWYKIFVGLCRSTSDCIFVFRVQEWYVSYLKWLAVRKPA